MFAVVKPLEFYMLEKHRLTYLDHLGIDNYMPRRALPNALPSQLLSDEALMEPTAFSTADDELTQSGIAAGAETNTGIPPKESIAPKDTAADASALDALNTLLGKTSDAVSATSPSTVDSIPETSHQVNEQADVSATVTQVSAPSAVEQIQEDIRFSLSVWRINNDIMVIDSRQPRTALPTDRLLQNILRSVGYSLAQLPPSDTLRWPLIKDDRLSHPESEARAMVQAFISAQCAKAPLQALLLLGENAVRFSLSIEGDSHAFYEQHKGSSCLQTQWNTTALIAPSLIDMLQDPMQKRVTWQALQHWMHSDTYSA